MHITITAPTFRRSWEWLGFLRGYWRETWDVTCTIVFTEEEKLRLKHFDDSYVLYSGRHEYGTWKVSVPEFVRRVSVGEPVRIQTKGEAEAYVTRLKTEILPRLKDLTLHYKPSKGETFEL